MISNGGYQALNHNFYKDFPFMKDHKDKVLLAGHFLKQDTYKQTMQRIKENKYRNIVIIGGSHSGFSAAWMLLNGPATYKKNNSINSTHHS